MWFENYRHVVNVFNTISSLSMLCAAFALLTLTPLYIGASYYNGTIAHQYAYTVSAAYKSGAVPMGLEFVFFILLLVVTVVVFQIGINWLNIHHIVNPMQNQTTAAVAISDQAPDEIVKCTEVGDSDEAATNVASTKKQTNTTSSAATTAPSDVSSPATATAARRFAVYGIFVTANFVAVLGVNIAYIYVALYRSNSLLLGAQVLLSAFKLIWNKFCCTNLVFWIAVYLNVDLATYEAESFAVQLFASLFNNIAIPCLTVAAISPACFYYLFTAPPAVSSQYTSYECELIDSKSGECLGYGPDLGTTTYNPPFSYSYQCSSSFITYYAPAFIILAIMSAFVTPAITIVLQLLHTQVVRYCNKDSLVFKCIDKALPRILKPLPLPAASATAPIPAAIAAPPSPPLAPYISQLMRGRYFDAHSLLVTMLTFFGILLTFGAVFPPVAVALAVTIVVAILSANLKVGRFLNRALEAHNVELIYKFEAECRNVGSSAQLQIAVWMLISFSCWFYTLFLFDTLGGSVGFGGAYWVLIVMPLMPLVMYVFFMINLKSRAGVLHPSARFPAGDRKDDTDNATFNVMLEL